MEDSTLGWRFVNPLMKERYGVDSMAETAENVAAECGICARRPGCLCLSQPAARRRSDGGGPAGRRNRAGRDSEEGRGVDADEHPRPDTTLEALTALRPIVRPGGTVTAGNASGINDGAGALLLASESAAAQYGLTPRARIVGDCRGWRRAARDGSGTGARRAEGARAAPVSPSTRST